MPCQLQTSAFVHCSGGVHLTLASHPSLGIARKLSDISAFFQTLDLHAAVDITTAERGDTVQVHCRLKTDIAQAWTPAYDTLQIPTRWTQPPSLSASAEPCRLLDLEILVALLSSPVPFVFVDLPDLMSCVRVRRFMVEAARKTALAFNTEAAERPAAFWRYDEENGFILQPGQSLICALICATQPEATGKLYDFSCYRATEYVILLGIAQEAMISNPALFQALQQRNELHAIRSGLFHEVFLVEYGSMVQPLPAHFYVPGDRLWFRNPDERSSDITGYEGSWVIYMGGGLFSNFWKQHQPYTLVHKCVEIYHWRHGAYTDAQGQLQMDEAKVETLVDDTLRNPAELARVLSLMTRMREPQGLYGQGGCIDTTREHPKHVSAHSCDLTLPAWP
jgi:hypothetical protein